MQQIRKPDKAKKKSPKNKFWNLSIWNKLNQTLVHLIGGLSNPCYEAQRLLSHGLRTDQIGRTERRAVMTGERQRNA